MQGNAAQMRSVKMDSTAHGHHQRPRHISDRALLTSLRDHYCFNLRVRQILAILPNDPISGEWSAYAQEQEYTDACEKRREPHQGPHPFDHVFRLDDSQQKQADRYLGQA